MLTRLVQQGYFKRFDVTKKAASKARKPKRSLSALNILDINSSLLTQKSSPVATAAAAASGGSMIGAGNAANLAHESQLPSGSSSSSDGNGGGGGGGMQPVGFLSTQDERLVYQMYVTLQSEDNGLGLAAPQVSMLKRLFLGASAVDVEDVYDPESKETYTNIANVQLEAYVNPRIVDSSKETVVDVEGCLSLPDYFCIIPRPAQVRVEYYNLLGERCVVDLDGMPARVFQHEMDHLDGVTMLHRIQDKKLDIFHLRDWEKYLHPTGLLKAEILERYPSSSLPSSPL